MKKTLFFLVAVLYMAVCNISCSSDDDEIVYNNQAVTLPTTKYETQAALFQLTNNAITATTSGSTFSLTSLNFTESGKAIVEVTSINGNKKYVTYNVDISGDTYTISDTKGVRGTVKESVTRSTSNTKLTITLMVEIPGLGTLSFNTDSPVEAQKVVAAVATVATNNIARTWRVHEMKLTLEGDVAASITEQSGNLGAFVKEAQDRGANLSQTEVAQLQRTIYGLTIDKNGLFSIEYSDNGTEACSWKWTDESQSKLMLQLHNSEFGNIFFSNNSNIEARFFASGVCHFIMTTKITGNKNYTATLLMVME